MYRYLRVWKKLSVNSFRTFFNYRFGAVLFLVGKIIRFTFFLGFLVILVAKTRILSGYNFWQVVLFYLTFNFIDAVTQMLFREVYRFRSHILTGNFDLLLVKPINTLFRILLGGTDFLDLITLLPFALLLGVAMVKSGDFSIWGLVSYTILMINSLVIAASFHILVMALAVITTEIDHAIMIYRDFTGMGKLPVDIYQEPLRSFITFIIPVGVMMTYPVKSFIGLLDLSVILMTVLFSLVFFTTSVIIWNKTLRHYASASS